MRATLFVAGLVRAFVRDAVECQRRSVASSRHPADGRITVGGVERLSHTLRNPVPGSLSFGTADELRYVTTPADVGQEIRCEITASNGAYITTRVDEALVVHAIPAEMDPKVILDELLPPPRYLRRSRRHRRVPQAELRVGALSKASLHWEGTNFGYPFAFLDATLTTFQTPVQADAQVNRRFCRDLRRSVRRSTFKRSSRKVAFCGRLTSAVSRKSLGAIVFAAGADAQGQPFFVVQAIGLASAGTSQFAVIVTERDKFRRRAAASRRAFDLLGVVGERLAEAAARE